MSNVSNSSALVISQLTALAANLAAATDALGETDRFSATGFVAEQISSGVTTLDAQLLGLLVSAMVSGSDTHKVVRGQYGGIMRDNEANQPKPKAVPKAKTNRVVLSRPSSEVDATVSEVEVADSATDTEVSDAEMAE